MLNFAMPGNPTVYEDLIALRNALLATDMPINSIIFVYLTSNVRVDKNNDVYSVTGQENGPRITQVRTLLNSLQIKTEKFIIMNSENFGHNCIMRG